MAEDGEEYTSFECDKKVACMPGTRYYMVFPAHVMQNYMTKQDNSMVNAQEDRIDFFDFYNDYSNVRDITLEDREYIYSSQEEKNGIIKELCANMSHQITEKGKNIFYISLEGKANVNAEIIVKASINLLFSKNDVTDLVFYSCNSELKLQIQNILETLFKAVNIESMFKAINEEARIIFFTDNYEESIFVMSSFVQTCKINQYISKLKCMHLDTMIQECRFLTETLIKLSLIK